LAYDILLSDNLFVHHSDQFSEQRSSLKNALSGGMQIALGGFLLPFARAEELSYPGIRDGNWKLFLLVT